MILGETSGKRTGDSPVSLSDLQDSRVSVNSRSVCEGETGTVKWKRDVLLSDDPSTSAQLPLLFSRVYEERGSRANGGDG